MQELEMEDKKVESRRLSGLHLQNVKESKL